MYTLVSIKNRPQLWGVPVRTGGVQMRTPALFGAKNTKFMVYLPRQGGGVLSQCGHFADKGGGVIFCDFVRMSFMNGS